MGKMEKIDVSEEKRYEELSPFELKNKLIQMAETHHERMMLNAGPGNPNWVATTPREGFFQLGLFAIEESHRMLWRPQVGGTPVKEGIANRFEKFVAKKEGASSVTFLHDAFVYVRDELRIEPDEFVREMTDAILGDHYLSPDRMLKCSEKIVHKYLEQEMCDGAPPPRRFDLFPTEGGGQRR